MIGLLNSRMPTTDYMEEGQWLIADWFQFCVCVLFLCFALPSIRQASLHFDCWMKFPWSTNTFPVFCVWWCMSFHIIDWWIGNCVFEDLFCACDLFVSNKDSALFLTVSLSVSEFGSGSATLICFSLLSRVVLRCGWMDGWTLIAWKQRSSFLCWTTWERGKSKTWNKSSLHCNI